MVVKEIRGRRRYIAFTVDPKFTKDTLIPKLRSRCGPDEAPYVVQCSKGWAIVRCPPERREATIELMRTVDPICVPLLTSGTLITLRRKYPILQDTRPPAKK
jgi:RNase P/RNase MRP subunit POP5